MISKSFVSSESPGTRRAGAGGRPCQGVYYAPEGVRPRVAMIATHFQIDFSEHYLAEHMAERGIGFLGWNTRYRGYESEFVLDRALVDLGVGVRWLKEEAGVEHVVLLGNSGGGSLMAAYHAQAVEPSVRPGIGLPPAPGVDDLIPGDAYVSLAAHLGRPEVITAWMDPAVVDEHDPTLTDPELDLFNPDNGPPFSAEFLARYRAAQVARNHRITAWAKAELARIQALGFHDRPFSVQRVWADPRMVDSSLDPSDRPDNACYRGDPAVANRSGRGLGHETSLRNWLGMWSLSESQCRAEEHLAKVKVPAIVINPDADAGVYPSDADGLYAAIASDDKQRIDLPGDHYFESPPGARARVADVVTQWIAERFPVSWP
ncbi:alpha/beta hydrolase family protein [Nonomuraea sp. CA-218870]|uniref:alpha/beta hydrolase family protein n=1 Tax=Nonomuraea sp. CA-218870 TaxID=3239998 RepID=UPI003D932542